MEVLVGSTFGIGRVRDQSSVAAKDQGVTASLFSKEDSNRIGLRRCGRSQPEELSESSSSVGESSGNEEEEDDDVSSQGRCVGSLTSSLEHSLPIKRGLSNHYIGKSKSFGNLLEASNAKDLEKVESPLNKRRRLLIANKLRRRRKSSLSSFSIYSKISPNSMPLLALQESDENDNKSNDDDDDDNSSDVQSIKLQEKRMKMTNNRDYMAQTQSCFSLTSFHDDDDP